MDCSQRVLIEIRTLELLSLELVERVRQGDGLLLDVVVVERLGRVRGLHHLLGVVESLPGLVAESRAAAPLLVSPQSRHGPAGLLLVSQSDLHKAGGGLELPGGEASRVQDLPLEDWCYYHYHYPANTQQAYLALLTVFLQDPGNQPGNGLAAHVLQLQAGEGRIVQQVLVLEGEGEAGQYTAGA